MSHGIENNRGVRECGGVANAKAWYESITELIISRLDTFDGYEFKPAFLVAG